MKYFICEQCGELTTSDQISNELSHGGSGYCYCQYMQLQWDLGYQDFEPVYLRHYSEWTEISDLIYSKLLKVSNTVKRLWMFRSIPKQERYE